MRKINEIIIHCTGNGADSRIGVADIDRYHRSRGFDGIGYHFVIMTDGTVERGRPLERAGAHCRGHNANSIGVAYVGGLAKDGSYADTRTPAQQKSLLGLLRNLRRQFPGTDIHGHRDFARKACPCFDATKEYSTL